MDFGTITRQGAASIRPAFFVDGTNLREGAREMLSRMARAGEVDFTLHPVVYGPDSRGDHVEMRAWMTSYAGEPREMTRLMTTAQLLAYVERHYDGGVRGFLFDHWGATAVADGS